MSIQTKSIGSGQSVQAQPENTTKLQATKKPAETKDTLKSISSDAQATETPKKSCGERIKECFNAILAWIKDKLLCCFYGKKSQGSESSSTASTSGASASKPKVETPAEKEANAAVRKFKEGLEKVTKKKDFSEPLASLEKQLKNNASNEEIRAILSNMHNPDLDMAFDKGGVDALKKTVASLIKLSAFIGQSHGHETGYFINDFMKSSPSKNEVSAVFRSLTKKAQAYLIHGFNQANKTNIQEEEFISIYATRDDKQKSPDSVNKTKTWLEEDFHAQLKKIAPELVDD